MLQDKHEIKQISRDTQNLSYEATLTAASLAKKIFKRLRENPNVKNHLKVDLDRPAHVQIDVDGKAAYRGVEGKDLRINYLAPSDLEYLNRALDLKAGQVVPDFKRDVSIKINEREVFRLRNGVVELNSLNPERTHDKSQTAETSQAEPLEVSLNDSNKDEVPPIQPRQIEIEDEASAPIQPRQIEREDEETANSGTSGEFSPSSENSSSINQQASQKPSPSKSPAQRQLDLRTLAVVFTARRLVSECGKVINGVRVFEGNAYQVVQTQEGALTINALDGRGTILELSEGRVQGNLTWADISQFKMLESELDRNGLREPMYGPALKEQEEQEEQEEQMELD